MGAARRERAPRCRRLLEAPPPRRGPREAAALAARCSLRSAGSSGRDRVLSFSSAFPRRLLGLALTFAWPCPYPCPCLWSSRPGRRTPGATLGGQGGLASALARARWRLDPRTDDVCRVGIEVSDGAATDCLAPLLPLDARALRAARGATSPKDRPESPRQLSGACRCRLAAARRRAG